MVAHESSLCHLKPDKLLWINGLYLLSSLGWKKTMTNLLKIIIQFETYDGDPI
jgi:hypothetical protein